MSSILFGDTNPIIVVSISFSIIPTLLQYTQVNMTGAFGFGNRAGSGQLCTKFNSNPIPTQEFLGKTSHAVESPGGKQQRKVEQGCEKKSFSILPPFNHVNREGSQARALLH